MTKYLGPGFPAAMAAALGDVPATVAIDTGVPFFDARATPAQVAAVEAFIAGYVPALTASQVALMTYANVKQWALATGGFTKTLSGTKVTFPTDQGSIALIDGKASRLGQPNPPVSINWQTATGWATISAADFMTAAVAIADFVQATFDEVRAAEAAIVDGTITTTAGIDAAPWPANAA